jgi:cell division inhibitor SulA/protein ImuA
MNLNELLQRAPIRRGASAPVQPTLSTGFDTLDELLHGGWPRAALTEILAAHEGIGELRLLLPALAEITRQKRWVAFVAPPYIPYAPALAHADLDLSRVLLIHPSAQQDRLWALEQALRAGTCGAVLAWPTQADFNTLRRLQLAAEAGNALGILFRPLHAAEHTSPAALRLKLEPLGASGRTIAAQVVKSRSGASSRRLTLSLATPCNHDARHRATSVERTDTRRTAIVAARNRVRRGLQQTSLDLTTPLSRHSRATAMDGGSAENAGAVFGQRGNPDLSGSSETTSPDMARYGI